MKRPAGILLKILLGAGLATLGTLGQILLWTWIVPNRFVLLYPVVIIAALLGGVTAGIAATLVAALEAVYFFFPPIYNFSIEEPTGPVPVLVFIAGGIAISIIAHIMERRQHRLNRLEIEAREQSVRGDQLRESEETLRTVFNSSYDGVMLHSPDGKVLDVNDRCLEMYAMDRPGMLGVSVPEISGASAPVDSLPSIWESVIAGQQKFFEWPARRRDGSEFDVEVFLRKLRLHGKDVVLANIRDITGRKAIENSLREALALRDEFLSFASHELKTPITALSIQTQLRKRNMLKQGLDSVVITANELEGDDRQVSRLTRLVDDMLDVSRITSGRLTIEPETFDICTLVQEVVNRFSPQCAQAGVRIEVKTCAQVTGFWDLRRIEQVLWNLLSNSLKYGGQTPIEVEVNRLESTVQIHVRDSGPGIPKEAQKRIFARFERAVSGRGISGLGLGLYISRRILELHGGTIRVQSEPGRGADFIVELPVTTPEGAKHA